MISITSLIKVLFHVIVIIMANPNIPQDTKDSVFTEITQAIGKENDASTTPEAVQATGTIASPEAQPVVELSHMNPTMTITKTPIDGNYVVRVSVSGDGWSKGYVNLTLRDGENVKSKASAFFGPQTNLSDAMFTIEPSQFGSYEYDYRLFKGSSVDSSLDTGTLVFSEQGTTQIGE